MDATHPAAVVSTLLVVLLSSWCLMRRFGAPPTEGRHASIDGLRGYLAVFVFVHHACIWYFYLRSGSWVSPPSALFTYLGEAAVAVFFMITAFLFFSKLMDSRSRGMDWARLFVSRVLRLVPLYLVAMLLVAVLVVHQSGGARRETWSALLAQVGPWLSFSMLSLPNINGVPDTFTMVAGVTWSLAYEWLFYLSLPLLARTLGLKASWPWQLIGCIGMACLLTCHPRGSLLWSFLGGMLAAWLVRKPAFTRLAGARWATVIVLACPVLAAWLDPLHLRSRGAWLLAISFALIAGGNSLFGVLRAPVSRTLGEMAYGIYLLHGLVLYAMFHLVFGTADAATWSPWAHWLAVAGAAPLLIGGCFLAFRFVEQPAMRLAASW